MALSRTKNTRFMTVSMEMVLMTKSRPRKNQTERWDLPDDYLAIKYRFPLITLVIKYFGYYKNLL